MPTTEDALSELLKNDIISRVRAPAPPTLERKTLKTRPRAKDVVDLRSVDAHVRGRIVEHREAHDTIHRLTAARKQKEARADKVIKRYTKETMEFLDRYTPNDKMRMLVNKDRVDVLCIKESTRKLPLGVARLRAGLREVVEEVLREHAPQLLGKEFHAGILRELRPIWPALTRAVGEKIEQMRGVVVRKNVLSYASKSKDSKPIRKLLSSASTS